MGTGSYGYTLHAEQCKPAGHSYDILRITILMVANILIKTRPAILCTHTGYKWYLMSCTLG